jgi:hypothetical protein
MATFGFVLIYPGCANRNVEASTKVTGNPTVQTLKVFRSVLECRKC